MDELISCVGYFPKKNSFLFFELNFSHQRSLPFLNRGLMINNISLDIPMGRTLQKCAVLRFLARGIVLAVSVKWE